MSTFPLVSMIRQHPSRYIVFFEAVYESDPAIRLHTNDDWDCSLVDECATYEPVERYYLWCHRHKTTSLNECECIWAVKRHRDDAGLTDNSKDKD